MTCFLCSLRFWKRFELLPWRLHFWLLHEPICCNRSSRIKENKVITSPRGWKLRWNNLERIQRSLCCFWSTLRCVFPQEERVVGAFHILTTPPQSVVFIFWNWHLCWWSFFKFLGSFVVTRLVIFVLSAVFSFPTSGHGDVLYKN